MDWEAIKRNALASLEEAKAKGEVDLAVLPLLNEVNRHEGWVTSSSCAGRIVIIRKAGRKEDSAFLFKWHRRITEEELIWAIRAIPNLKNVFLRAESFILHVLCKDLDWSSRLLSLAREAGIKKGGLQNLRGKLLVELRGNVNLCIPLEDVMFSSVKITGILNGLMDENENARERFKEVISRASP